MIKSTLVLLVKNQPITEILLGYKKIGFGAGKITGFGGKVEPGESISEAAVRELREETGILLAPTMLSFVALLFFRFPEKATWNQKVHVFTGNNHGQKPRESKEISPKWFSIGEIPFEAMWDDARYWLPRILAGETFEADFIFKEDNANVAVVDFRPLAS